MTDRQAELAAAYPWYAPHQRWLIREAGGVRADFRGADLANANFRGADFRRADLSGAFFSGADFRDANLSGADLYDVYLSGADLRGATLPDGVPIIQNIDAAILAAIDAGGTLDMAYWHTCETTHCRAGWAITLAGDAGKALEDRYGSSVAGALIYAVSRPDQPVPDFSASDDEAMADMRRCAKVRP